MKDALVIHINSVAVQMVLRFNKDHMATDAIANKRNSNAVPTASQLQLDQTSKDVLVQPANTDVVQMVLQMHNLHNSMDVMMFHQQHKKHVALRKMPVLVPITPLNSSSIWNMAVAHGSGTAVAVAMKIVLNRMKNVKAHVLHQLAKMHAKCQKFMDHALDIIRNSIMIQIEIFAHHSSMVDAWATRIDSKQWKNVNSNVLLMNRYVSLITFSDNCQCRK